MIEYKVSSFCSYGNCVEVGRTPDGRVAVRDSKNRDQAPLVFSMDAWADFVSSAKSGQFDLD